MNMSDLKISTRLRLGFSLMALLIVVMGAISMLKVSETGKAFNPDEFRQFALDLGPLFGGS